MKITQSIKSSEQAGRRDDSKGSESAPVENEIIPSQKVTYEEIEANKAKFQRAIERSLSHEHN